MTSRARRKHKAKNKLRRKLKEMLHAFSVQPPPVIDPTQTLWGNNIAITPQRVNDLTDMYARKYRLDQSAAQAMAIYNARVEAAKIQQTVAIEKTKILAGEIGKIESVRMIHDETQITVRKPKRREYPLMVKPKLLGQLIRRLK